MLDIYNKIWEEGEIPKTRKHTTIAPLLKEAKDQKDVKSYRSVALKTILCKIFERMTNKRLIWILEREKKINDKQFGLRKRKPPHRLGTFTSRERSVAVAIVLYCP